MKSLLFFLLFIIFFISNTLAIGFSPSSLVYELYPNQEECNFITINSNSNKITLIDKWAQNKEEEWDAIKFNTSSKQHNILISYPKEISSIDKVVKICLSGENEDEYHGAIIITEEQLGNSIVQAAIWLKVTIQEKNQETPPSLVPINSNQGGSSSSTKTPIEKNNTQNSIEQKEIKKEIQELSNPIIEKEINSNEEQNNKIQEINEESYKLPFYLFIIIIVFALLTAIFSIWKRKPLN